MTEFLQSLNKRKLVQWVVAYVAAAFALLQGLDIVAQQFGWSDTIRRGTTLALVVGFFITLILAWYHGEQGRQRVTGMELLIVALLLGIGGGLMWNFARESSHPARQAQALAEAQTSPKQAVSAKPDEPASGTTAPSPKSIAVLPFANLSTDEENGYFATGIQDEILTRLARIGDLKVISRTSTEKYKSRPENLRKVAAELLVANILEGSVQKAGDQVLINVQLINALTDQHIWADSYKRTLTDIFGVEGEVAQTVATELKAKLTEAEEKSVTAKMTENPEAYDVYLKGLVAERKLIGFAPAALPSIEKDYAEAVRLDPRFAEAWARLSQIRTGIYAAFVDRSPQFLAKARQAADTALKLNPELGEGYLALARYHYLALRDMKGALPPVQKARELLPNNADVLTTLAEVQERQNHWQEANEDYRLAVEQDPRSVARLSDLAYSYMALHQFAKAREILDRALVLTPGDVDLIAIKASSYQAQGNLDAADKLLNGITISPQQINAFFTRIDQYSYRGQFADAISKFRSAIAMPKLRPPALRSIYRSELARFLELAGKDADARKTAKQALVEVTSQRKSDADDHVLASFIAGAYAVLGDKQQALHWALRSVEANSTCSVCEASAETRHAAMQVRFGEIDAALAALPHLLTVPDGPTVAQLRLSPAWKPLRKNPRFQAILKKYEDADVQPASPDASTDRQADRAMSD